MPIHIQCGKDFFVRNKTEVKIQSLPFSIHADCDANVGSYFQTYVKVQEDNSFTASFRGRPLKGVTIKVPEGYFGVVFHESNMKYLNETEDRTFYVLHRFNTFLYWNWDKMPSKNDTLIQALDWLDVSAALHSPIEEELL